MVKYCPTPRALQDGGKGGRWLTAFLLALEKYLCFQTQQQRPAVLLLSSVPRHTDQLAGPHRNEITDPQKDMDKPGSSRHPILASIHGMILKIYHILQR